MRKQIAKVYMADDKQEIVNARNCKKKGEKHYSYYFFAEILSFEKVENLKNFREKIYKLKPINEHLDIYEVDKFLDINNCEVIGDKKLFKTERQIKTKIYK